MPRRRVHLAPPPAVARSADAVDADVERGLADLRDQLDVPAAFPADVVAEAESAATAGAPADLPDATGVPFVTIDPPGSRDLDQAVHIERRGDGFRVRYAIADVATWVRPGGAVDTEARRRVVTLYAPDGRTPLHPPALSEGAASLLPDQDVPALLWTIDLDAGGAPTAVDVRRSRVRSRAQLTYDEVQQAYDAGTADGTLALLRDVGRLRQDAERARGGITLPTPEQEVQRVDGHWALVSRSTLDAEEWNAQISLLTGLCAAQLMLDGRIGVLRTLPPADPRDVARLRRAADALDVPWPEGAPVGDVVRGLDAAIPAHAALLTEATTLLRGAAYVAFDGEVPEQEQHAALAAPYAHTTAPLRRLVDRFVGETCVALVAGQEVPDWARSALPDLPGLMAGGDRRANEYERGCLDLLEAALLTGRVGDVFDGVVVDAHDDRASGVVQLRDPVVRARVEGTDLPVGQHVRVRLTEVSAARRAVRFALDGQPAARASAPGATVHPAGTPEQPSRAAEG
ncbi:RNB domain-containing ribonuclease [Cellulomonas sp. H30R-01]|uniref:RNB domain-containing ribonuclease n=1 Tax=Cellulomonas sp. H30R-01 TaxID=2704467 RepID=UPI00138CAF6F|nr:RNB domain-containing ribonuclease [Cellulomonas sp. H30R-01]QHT57277.1 RNB domain-containing ribonuclease [Cellulomonas sp. H30R-01]